MKSLMRFNENKAETGQLKTIDVGRDKCKNQNRENYWQYDFVLKQEQ